MIRAYDLPPIGGAYAIVIETRRPADMTLRGVNLRLSPGRYLYCGSARGPGGIRARVGRHLRKSKAQRWHVDRLTGIGRVCGVIVAPDGSECALFARFSGLKGAEVPAPGFGSSDCRRCAAHLLRLEGPVPEIAALPLEPSEYLVLDAAGRRHRNI